MKTTKYTIFGKTREVPLVVYLNGKKIDSENYEETLWVERPEDWYALLSPELFYKKTLVVDRKDWLKAGRDAVWDGTEEAI